MKKIFLLLLFVFCGLLLLGCSSEKNTPISDIVNADIGDVVKLGAYKGRPINWNIVYKQDGACLLVANRVIEEKPYNVEGGSIEIESPLFHANEWSVCSLREWLNMDFYDKAFSEETKKYIVQCELTNSVSEAYTKSGGEDTVDNVFILSLSECKELLLPLNLLEVGDRFWLRNPSGTNGLCARTGYGEISLKEIQSSSVSDVSGIRPAIWVTDNQEVSSMSLYVPAATHGNSSNNTSSNTSSPDNFGYYDYDGDGSISDDEFLDALDYYIDENGY